MQVVGVRFKSAGKVYYFDPTGFEIEKANHVIVETVRGVEYGEVVGTVKEMEESELILPLKPVLRIADEADHYIHRKNLEKAIQAKEICEGKILEHGLEMKLIDVEYTFDNNKVIFYFTADGRIDFRELVKDLASVFRTRIELRQIGVRDQAKIIGALGSCGQVCCCHRFLGDFAPVSIKMAKDQNLSLNPIKISGVCGRLMCCLHYEEEAYEDLNHRVPAVGSTVETPEGRGIVVESQLLRERLKVKLLNDPQSDELFTWKVDEVKVLRKSCNCPKREAEEVEK